MKRWFARIGLIATVILIGVAGLWLVPERNPVPPAGPPTIPTVRPPGPASGPRTSPDLPVVAASGDCASPAFAAAAADNAASLDTLAWAPFRGRAEVGWRIYGPRIAEAVGVDCPFDSAGFAAALAGWQAEQRLPADGRMTPDTFQKMRTGWDLARPFQRAARNGCPPAPDPATLMAADRAERFGERAELLYPATLVAYRSMVAAARAAGVATEPDALTIFSAFRDPAADATRCAAGGCGGAERAVCSAHRTGTALDLNLGHAPDSRVDSTDDANRLWMSQTPTYLWLVRNAGRYGFVNYAFEPWHWEWAG